MSAILWSDVVALVPNMASVGATAQTYILAHVNADLSVNEFDGEDGPTTRLARIYLAAHLASSPGVTASGSTAPGPVSSESAGGLSRSYAIASATSGDGLGLTYWGQQYLGLAKVSFARLPLLI